MNESTAIELGSSPLSFDSIDDIIVARRLVTISQGAEKKLETIYQAVKKAAHSERPIYGINTGFGALAETRIDVADQSRLQKNILLSHAVGVGEPLDFLSSRTLLLLRLNTLVQGYSGASPSLIDHLCQLLNSNCAPLVPRKGSVGASGDLAPLAHLGLLLLGIGDAMLDGRVVSAHDALAHAGIPVLSLGVRDGLAIINGTQAMASVAVSALRIADHLSLFADVTASVSIDALAGHLSPFDARIHRAKPHRGQIATANNILRMTSGRRVHELVTNSLTQDPYSLRCVPQVHGASKDVIVHVKNVVGIEINSATDNPLIFVDNGDLSIVSGGNFHGQHLALALDYLAMGVAELANISERRIELLLNHRHSNGLPPFLAQTSGLNSGYMMLHVTASALVNENKVLCHPASVDSIPTSASREDHVSMGMTSANKLMSVIENTKTVLAIELLAACQALDFRPRESAGFGVQKIHAQLRKHVSFRAEDGLYKDDVAKAIAWIDHAQDFVRKLVEESR